jgi:hypothetical protein
MKSVVAAALLLSLSLAPGALADPASQASGTKSTATEAASQGAQQAGSSSEPAPEVGGGTNPSPGSPESGTVYPQDETHTRGNTSGTARVNNLANLEALLNIIANGAEILGFLLFWPILLLGIAGTIIGGKQRWIGFVVIGAAFVVLIGGLCTPGVINWAVTSARDAGMFN